MTILTVFRTHLASSQYVFKDGRVAHFIKRVASKPAEFLTDVESHIKELHEEITDGHPHIFTPENEAEKTVDTEYDPVAALRNKIRDEERAKLVAEMNVAPKIGTSTTAVKPILQGQANTNTLNSNNPNNAPVIQVPNQVITPIPVSETTAVDTSQEIKSNEDPEIPSGNAVKSDMAAKLAALKAK